LCLYDQNLKVYRATKWKQKTYIILQKKIYTRYEILMGTLDYYNRSKITSKKSYFSFCHTQYIHAWITIPAQNNKLPNSNPIDINIDNRQKRKRQNKHINRKSSKKKIHFSCHYETPTYQIEVVSYTLRSTNFSNWSHVQCLKCYVAPIFQIEVCTVSCPPCSTNFSNWSCAQCLTHYATLTLRIWIKEVSGCWTCCCQTRHRYTCYIKSLLFS